MTLTLVLADCHNQMSLTTLIQFSVLICQQQKNITLFGIEIYPIHNICRSFFIIQTYSVHQSIAILTLTEN